MLLETVLPTHSVESMLTTQMHFLAPLIAVTVLTSPAHSGRRPLRASRRSRRRQLRFVRRSPRHTLDSLRLALRPPALGTALVPPPHLLVPCRNLLRTLRNLRLNLPVPVLTLFRVTSHLGTVRTILAVPRRLNPRRVNVVIGVRTSVKRKTPPTAPRRHRTAISAHQHLSPRSILVETLTPGELQTTLPLVV